VKLVYSNRINVFVLQAQFVPHPDPSLKEQYEYATEHDIKCLIIITEAGLSQTDLVKVAKAVLKLNFFFPLK
jgi:hypothetical protein